jgi:hypothetical protein
MPSITAWTRLEPDPGQGDLGLALQARLRDPLWLLARQWQTGEFEGEDTGTAVSVRLRGTRSPLARFYPGPLPPGGAVSGQSYDASRLPLEVVVEREAIRTPGPEEDRFLAAEAGITFFSILARHKPAGLAKLRRAYLAAYPLELPPAGDMAVLDATSRRRLALLAGRAPNGFHLYADLAATLRPASGSPKLPATPQIDAGDRDAVLVAGLDYLSWYDGLYVEAPSGSRAWQPERMEYAFAASAAGADGEIAITAAESMGGDLEWYSFDLAPGATLGAAQGDPQPEDFVSTVMPAPVAFRGMPADRWWEFEDAVVNFGRVDAAPDDLLRLTLTSFALLYSNDWLIAPLTARIGAFYQIHSLVVTDSFGQRTLIPHYSALDGPAAAWRLYMLNSPPATGASVPGGSSLLFLPPVLPAGMHSTPIEEVALARDEMANLAWAMEKEVSGPAGLTIDRYEAYQRRQAVPAEAGAPPVQAGDAWLYRLATTVPDYWFPLVPVRIATDRPDVRLVLGRMLAAEGGEPTLPAPRGRLLAPQDLSLFEEEVPRSALQITRAWRYTRAADGTTCVWIGRRKAPGRGPAFSGLRYDVIDTT